MIHIGIESWSGGRADGVRHIMNALEMKDFDPKDTHLRWVYGEYVAPEVTTREDEAWAVEETSAPYQVGRHRVPAPLPDHFILGDETQMMAGVHWDPTSQIPMNSGIIDGRK